MKRYTGWLLLLLFYKAGLCQMTVETEKIAGNTHYHFNTMPQGKLAQGIITPENLNPPSLLTPRFRQFVEFGDGYFSNRMVGAEVITQLTKLSGENYKPLIVTHGIYTPVPPTLLSELQKFTVEPVPFVLQDYTEGRHVKIVPSINSTLPNDLLTFALPFKASAQFRNGYLVFLYNNNEFPGQVFKHIAGTDSITWFNDDQAAIKVPAVRGLGENMAYTARYLGGSVGDFQKVLQQNDVPVDLNYQDALIFDITSISDLNEHNLFISLQTNDSTSLVSVPDYSTLSVKCVFVPYSFSTSKKQAAQRAGFNPDVDTVTEHLSFFQKVRDPNATGISPACVKPGSKNLRFTFTMRISNEATGIVRRTLLHPYFKGASIKLKNIQILKAIIGGIDRTNDLKNGGQNKLIQDNGQADGQFVLNLDSLTGVDSSYSFKALSPLLQGAPFVLAGLPAGKTPESYGGTDVYAVVSFSAEAESLPSSEDSSSLVAAVSFGGGLGMEPYFLTPHPGMLRISNHCDGPPPTCDSFWCRYWWLIILILLAALLLIYIATRRKNP